VVQPFLLLFLGKQELQQETTFLKTRSTPVLRRLPTRPAEVAQARGYPHADIAQGYLTKVPSRTTLQSTLPYASLARFAHLVRWFIRFGTLPPPHLRSTLISKLRSAGPS
jgi:hypothetical protein